MKNATTWSIFRKAALAACIGSTILLSGCGGDDKPEPQIHTEAESKDQARAEAEAQMKANHEKARRGQSPSSVDAETRQKAVAAERAKREAVTTVTTLDDLPPAPEGTQYLSLEDSENLVFGYQALADTPDPLPYLAVALTGGEMGFTSNPFERSSKELEDKLGAYIGESDGFKKRDALAQLEPLLAQEIQKHKEMGRYVKVSMSQHDFFNGSSDYDFDKGGFRAGSSMFTAPSDAVMSMNDSGVYGFRFSNGKDVAFLPLKDEVAARKLQAALKSANTDIEAHIYGYIKSVHREGKRPGRDEQRMLDVQIQRLELVNKANPSEVYASYTY